MKKEVTGGNFLAFGAYAFAGVGMELVLLFLEKIVFRIDDLNAMTPTNKIIHWILTCVVWGAFAFVLASYARRHYGFNIMGERKNIPALNIIIAVILAALCIASNAWSWGTLKILGELKSKSLLLFAFQYLYYIFEVFLILSIIAYGQKAGEMWFGKEKFPWGGLLVGLSWGLMHAFTKGSLLIGLEALASGILYGCIYLLMRKRAVYAYPLIMLAFVL